MAFPRTSMGAILKKFPTCVSTYRNAGVVIDEASQVCYGSPTGYPIGIDEIDSWGPLVALSSNGGEAACLIGFPHLASVPLETIDFLVSSQGPMC